MILKRKSVSLLLERSRVANGKYGACIMINVNELKMLEGASLQRLVFHARSSAN